MEYELHPEELYLIELTEKAYLASLNDSILLAIAISVVLGIYFYGTKDD
jgi:hypothetical protein|tara:strand:+ start:8955 stop:9101 length:147 start_codon:yes stop_codon:yes gene_type:complete